jgi:hypothetical protein
VLVRAASFKDAVRRLRTYWRQYARPHLNSDGLLVRWQLEEIVDVYSTLETDVDDTGFEVYSRLSERRMKRGRPRR